MTTSSSFDQLAVAIDQRVLRAAVAAYLGRYRGESRVHTGSALTVFLTLCSGHELDPLDVGPNRDRTLCAVVTGVRRYQPSTVARRLSVVVGFHRVCVIDQIPAPSPADYVRRPPLPTESPTLELGHLRPRTHPHMLRHTFVTTMLDARVSSRDVQIAARHHPRPYMASGTRTPRPVTRPVASPAGRMPGTRQPP